MGQLVHERYLGLAGDDRVDVHLVQELTTVFEGSGRHDFQIADRGTGVGPVIGLHPADDHIGAAVSATTPLAEHRIGFTHPGGVAQIDAQPGGLPVADLPRVARSGRLFHIQDVRTLNKRRNSVQREVQLEHVDAWLTENAQVARGDVTIDQVAHLLLWHRARRRNARCLR